MAVLLVNRERELEPQPDEEFGDWFGRVIKTLAGGDYATAAFGRDRPYDGQPHTHEGTRGSTLVEGLTFRDIADCFVIGAFRSTGFPKDQYPDDVYAIDWNDLDPMAVCQNMLIAIEERMGIYPNVPPLIEGDQNP